MYGDEGLVILDANKLRDVGRHAPRASAHALRAEAERAASRASCSRHRLAAVVYSDEGLVILDANKLRDVGRHAPRASAHAVRAEAEGAASLASCSRHRPSVPS